MKVAVAVLVCVVIQQACGFSFPSFEVGNEALEKIKEAGREIIAKASKNVEGIQETVEEKIKPTETVKKMWKEIEEKVGNQQEEWKEKKKQMKEMYKDLKKKAGENKDELVKMWKENKSSWRQQAEEKWQSFKSMTVENLDQFKREIDSLEERLDATAPEKPWKKIKDIRLGVKSLIIAMKEAFQVKLRELKEKAELGPGAEEELSEEESEVATGETFTNGPFTDGPFTDKFAETISVTTEPEELPSTPDVITDQLEPTDMLSTPVTEEPPTEYSDEDWNQEVVNDEQQTGEESDEEEGEDEVLPEEPIEEEAAGGIEEESEEEGPVSEKSEESSRINVLSRKRHWLKRGKAMKNKLKNWFKKRWGEN